MNLIFPGTDAAIQLPSFYYTYGICQTGRSDFSRRRTRSSVSLLGAETALIDAGPDLENQLERVCIRQVDRIFSRPGTSIKAPGSPVLERQRISPVGRRSRFTFWRMRQSTLIVNWPI